MDSEPVALNRRNCGNSDCPRWFWLCGHCDKVRRYCGELCRKQARTRQHRLANRRYQDGVQGRRYHSARQGRYRARQRSPEKKVTDQTSLTGVSGSMLEPCCELPEPALAPRQFVHQEETKPRCHGCGRLGAPAEGTAGEMVNGNEPAMAVDCSPRQYVNQLLAWYEQLPDTLGPPRVSDRELARWLFARRVPAQTVETALLLASLRRLTRDQARGALPRIRSLAYFLPVVEELLAEPVKPGYREYLRHKLQALAPRRRA